jgi:hypothetical protein
MDRPPIQPPKSSPASNNNDSGAGCSAATARKGTGVFIPPCMIKSSGSS